MSYIIRKAKITDVKAIYDILKSMSSQQLLLPRSLANLYEMVQTFWVAEEESTKQVVGTAALQVAWEDLGEVRSLAVKEEHRGHNLGKDITLAVEAEAREINIKRLFTLTYVPEFFKKLSFNEIPLSSLPEKIWSVCFQCVHYPDCKEIALIKFIA